MAAPVHVTDDTFQQEVLDHDTPVVVDFWAEWCMPCKPIAQIVEELSGEYDGRVKFAKVDVDTNQQVAASFGIRSIPVLLFFKGGEVADLIIGTVPKRAVVEKLDSLL